jgi:ankyrin repeat protein
MRILQWLTFSARPLTVKEVAEVVAIDVTREPAFDSDEVLTDPLEVLDICSGLVTIVEMSGHHAYSAELEDLHFHRYNEGVHIVTLAHYSVQEYLLSDRIKQGPAKQYSMQEVDCHVAITKGTMAYLNQFQQPIPEDVLEYSALAVYSARFWIHHFRKTRDERENLSRLVMDLFSVENTLFLTWNQLYDPDSSRHWPDLNISLENIPTPLYYGALLGLPIITKFLLGRGADVNAQGGRYGHALSAAAAHGHKDVVELLIKVNNDVNVRVEEFRGALQIASQEGHEAVVKLLIEAGADVNTPVGFKWDTFRDPWSEYYRNALQAAIQGAHETIVRMLLEGGASVGVNPRTESAMHYATDRHNCTSSLVKMLQQYGAPLDSIDVNNMTPLLYCTKREYKAIAGQLIDAGASVDLKVRRKAVPSGASGSKYMLANTELPNLESGLAGGLTALHFAALNGSVSMTKFLLKHGADPNILSEERQTPLHLALSPKLVGKIKHDDWNYCRNLAKWRYDISQYGTDKTSAYFKAARSRERTINALLTDPRISVTSQDYRGESALHYVQYGRSGSADLVRKLLSKGADALCVNSSQQTPLHLASEAGDRASVRVLLVMGAKVEFADKSGLNALHYAARSGDLETIIAISNTPEARTLKLLESKDKYGRNALHHILSKKHVRRTEAPQWLLDQGVNGSELDGIGLSPLATYISGSMFEIDSNICRSLFKIKGNALFTYCHGQTLGHLCATKSSFGLRVLQALNKYGVDLFKKDYDGRTVLHRAAMCAGVDEASLEFLVDSLGIQASEEDKHGRIALQYAIEEHAKGHKHNRSGTERWERTKDVLLKHHADHKNEYRSSFTQLLPELLKQRPPETTKRERESSPVLFITDPYIPFPGVRRSSSTPSSPTRTCSPNLE